MKPRETPKALRSTKLRGTRAHAHVTNSRLNQKGIAPKELPSADSLISRRDFVALLVTCHVKHAIVSGDKKYDTAESKERLRSRLSHRVGKAIGKKFLASKPGWFRFGDAATWARIDWPSECVTFPANPVTFNIHGTVPMSTMSALAHVEPATLPECQAALAGLYIKNAKLVADVAALQAENKLLRESVDEHERKARERSFRSSEAGKKGGRGKRQ